MDVDATNCTLADDFECTMTGPLTDIHIWCSLYHNMGDPMAVMFTLRIFSDDPVGPGGSDPENRYSKPDKLLWQRTFNPGEFEVMPPSFESPEGWYSPCMGMYEPVGDTMCWLYNFYLLENEFRQEGSPNRPVRYWLSMHAQPTIPTQIWLGWKTSEVQQIDDAVWHFGELPWTWNEMHYPPQHPYYPRSLDLAFVINGKAEEPPQHDLGDAPDSTNSFGTPPPLLPMTAYPKGGPMGIQANYPTVFVIGSPPFGPIHMQPLALAHLGQAVTLENEADIGPDQDGMNNIIPPQNSPDLDGKDDGVIFPLVLPRCEWTTFDFWVTIAPFMPPVPDLYVNVWFDWNRDGDWDDTMQCPGATAPTPAPEWAVRNQLLPALPPGLHKIPTSRFLPWHPATGDMLPIWMRITLSEQKWSPTSGVLGDGGSGPANGYMYGETEDYYFVPEVPPPELDFGDAPEAWTAGFRYPTTLANNGARHIIVSGVCLGWNIDAEADGQPTLAADGDDINGFVNDEDGVTYRSAIVPGGMVDVNIVASVAGSLSAWLDYNRDGDWDEADETVFSGYSLSAGENDLQFNVPVTAVPGVTYARLRFTTADTALRYDGQTDDGEVEDYIVKIEEMPVKPLAEHLKWSQPPIERNPQSKTPVYCGWDEPSFKEEWEPPPIWKIVADDFRCLGSMPITSIHWWGSYVNWDRPQPPAVKPIAWKIGFWSNVPPSPVGGISHPGKLLWQIDVAADRVQENWAGFDQLPDIILETCFQYYVDLTPLEYFWQQKFIDPQTKDDVFWLSIVAVYPLGPLPPNLWGWKTRPWHWMDDAVTFTIQGDLKPDYVLDPSIVRPLEYCGQSYDAAFELDTDPNYIKWEQAFTGIRDWPHYEDEESMATVDTVVETVTKWTQKPDTGPNGIDVDASDDIWRPQLLADDFPCTMTGPITDFHIWGSWYHDHPPFGNPTAVTFILSIHENLPVGNKSNPYPYSIPGKVLWLKKFAPGEFQAQDYARLKEGWFVPCAEPQYYDSYADNICWLYTFFINPSEAFIQQQGNIYWLDVQAIPTPEIAFPEPIRFGWKDSPTHFMDNAVWATTEEPVSVPGPWHTLIYPLGHPYAGRNIDLAFAITTNMMYKYTQEPDLQTPFSIDIDATKDQIWNPQVLADDFKCITTEPVTDIHIWGSWYHNMVPGDPNNVEFTLSIHADIPAGPVNPYSIPGTILWQRVFKPGEFKSSIYADQREGYFVPCVEPQYYEPGGDSICVQYDFYVDPCSAFIQRGTSTKSVVYWLSVQARPSAPAGAPPMRSRFGWKTTALQYHWNDDAVWSKNGGTTWNELRYPPGHPYGGQTADLAFSITTQKQYEKFNLRRQVADDWRCESRSPVTTAVWWGSYIGYGYEACQCQTTTPRPTKPDYFLLSIWTDVPANPGDPSSFSHPSEKKWEYKADKYDEVLVGYDKHPEPGEPGTGGYEPVFRYSVKLPKEKWYLQKDVNEVFWFSVMAVYKDPVSPIVYPWGWTNHQCQAWEPKGLDEVAYWKLNETSGIIASDSSGNGNDGTLVGNPTWTTGKICGGALDLNGNGDYVKTADTTTGLNFAPGSFSVSAWIKPRQVTGSWRTILEYDRNNNDKNRFGMWLSAGGNFHFRVGNDTKSSNQILNANQWYILTATYDSTSKTMSLYINGQFDSSTVHSNGFNSPNVAKLTIGVRGTEDAEYFDGLVDDVRIYNRKLEASEVRALADMGKNDDAAAWELDPTGQWKWTPLTDQTGRSEDMSFVLFTDPNVCVNCADYNLDGIVDFKDLKVFVDNWLWTGPSGGCNNGDLDCDGDVEFHDFAILASQWLNSCP
jgi:hypothetical protein